MNTSIPEQHIHKDDAPKLRSENDLLQVSPLHLSVRLVSCASEPLLSDVNVMLVEDTTVGLIRRAGEDEKAQDTDGDGDNCANDVHPSPSFKTSHAIKTGGGASLDEASS